MAVYGEKTVRMAERAWFLSAEEENEALGINGNKWGQAPFIP
jgi:hypothetical protein